MSKINEFFWYGLATTDTAAAKDFYTKVVNWELEDASAPGYEYTVVKAQGTGVGGIRPILAGQDNQSPAWVGYVCVADCAAKTQELKAAGGKVLREAVYMEGVGTISVVSDPGGAVFALLSPQGEDREWPGQHADGNVGWHEVLGGTLDEATAFYHGLFGWNKTEALEMGPAGTYQMFNFGEGDSRGGMMAKCPGGGAPAWNFYFNVPSAGKAIEAINSNGGTVVMGPQEVPGGAWILHAIDPQGGHFALAAAQR